MGHVVVRPAEPGDAGALAELCRQHAAFESTPEEPVAALPADLADRLARAMSADPATLWCFLADRGGELVGYSSYAWCPSSWRGDAYVLMDCLFVVEGERGSGVGRRLFDAGAARARELGATRMQWQASTWNDGALRFYERTGASTMRKLRYSLPLEPAGERRGARSEVRAEGPSATRSEVRPSTHGHDTD